MMKLVGFGLMNFRITKEVIEKHIKNNKQICIVSPDLHKREWQHYKIIDNLMICTDYPEIFYMNKIKAVIFGTKIIWYGNDHL